VDQFLCEGEEPIWVASSSSELESQIAPFDIPKLSQPFQQAHDHRVIAVRGDQEVTNRRDPR
jgi:hypothetical protein